MFQCEPYAIGFNFLRLIPSITAGSAHPMRGSGTALVGAISVVAAASYVIAAPCVLNALSIKV
jgi:hypothetical protein